MTIPNIDEEGQPSKFEEGYEPEEGEPVEVPGPNTKEAATPPDDDP